MRVLTSSASRTASMTAGRAVMPRYCFSRSTRPLASNLRLLLRMSWRNSASGRFCRQGRHLD